MKKKGETKQKRIQKNVRVSNEELQPSKSAKRTAETANISKSREELDNSIETEELVFEDPFEDEFEEEEIDEDETYNECDENDLLGTQQLPTIDEKDESSFDRKGSASDSAAPKKVWRPDIDKINDGEALDYDPSAYVMYHSLQTEWPCLSFDIIKDSLGDNRQRVRMNIIKYLTPFYLFHLCKIILVSSDHVYGDWITGGSSNQKQNHNFKT